ncbi:MAG: hypothetical protein V5A55_07515 [Halovenus sp.]
MQTISDDRRLIYVHPNATVDDLPVSGEVELMPVGDEDPFVPKRMEDPQIYPGDVIVSVVDDGIWFAELVIHHQNEYDISGVVVKPLNERVAKLVPDSFFSARLFQANEIHIYEGIGEVGDEPDIEFDASKLETPVEGQPR